MFVVSFQHIGGKNSYWAFQENVHCCAAFLLRFGRNCAIFTRYNTMAGAGNYYSVLVDLIVVKRVMLLLKIYRKCSEMFGNITGGLERPFC